MALFLLLLQPSHSNNESEARHPVFVGSRLSAWPRGNRASCRCGRGSPPRGIRVTGGARAEA